MFTPSWMDAFVASRGYLFTVMFLLGLLFALAWSVDTFYYKSQPRRKGAR